MRLQAPILARMRAAITKAAVQALGVRDLFGNPRDWSPGAWQRGLQLARVPADLVGHDRDLSQLEILIRVLRHCSALEVVRVANSEDGATLLGHVDTRMVERHYRHRLSASVDVAVAPMGELLEEPTG